MEAMSGLTGTDALAVMNSRNGYGYNDGFGCDGGWFWIIIILFFAWGNNGWGNGNNANAFENRFLERDVFDTNMNVSNSTCQTQRDVLETKYDLGTQILGNRYDLGTQILENRYQTQLCCCDTQKEVLENRYQNALQTQTITAQLAQCCCDLRAEGLANTQKILDKLCENEINQLRTDLQSAQLQISQLSQTANIVNSIIPRPTPSYPSCSPFVPSYFGFNGNGCGCNNGCGCGNLI